MAAASLAGAILVAAWLDRRFGEPGNGWHPVAWLGRLLAVLGRPLPDWRPALAFGAGALLWSAVIVGVGWLAWRLWQVPEMRRSARWLVGLALWQFASGLTNVVLDWPLLAAVAHTGGAAALVIVMTGALIGTRSLARDSVTAPFSLSRSAR